MAPHYKLTYFNSRGFAETSRFILAEAGVDYVDNRIDKEKDWPALKPKTPFNKVPILEIDGTTVISESRAIARYLAREHKLAGKNNLEAAQCDMLVDACYDFMSHLSGILTEKDEHKKTEIKTKFATEIVPPAFDNYTRILEKNGGGKGFIVGDSLTWADLGLAHVLWGLQLHHAPALEKRPLLKAYMERILSRPNIKAWMSKRPVTDL